MATRSILTHQPDVECDVCGRRLLRGERPDAFLDGGERRIVCELCVPRAIGAGWTRESEALAAAAPRGRQGRSLMGRLRQRRQPQRGDGLELDDAGGEQRWGATHPYDVEDEAEPLYSDAYAGAGGGAADDMDALSEEAEGDARDDAGPGDGAPHAEDSAAGADDAQGAHARPGRALRLRRRAAESEPTRSRDGARTAPRGAVAAGGNGGDGSNGSSRAASVDAAALLQFNASAAAGRMAGIARSLGEPAVTVRPFDGSGGEKVSIVVAWELCWYRYAVDLSGETPVVSLAGEGMELDELPGEDRVVNARADERGELSLVA